MKCILIDICFQVCYRKSEIKKERERIRKRQIELTSE